MTKLNISLSGRSGSGKTTIANYLASKYNFHVCKTGTLCRDVSKLLFRSDSLEILQKVTDAMKDIDKDVWLKGALYNAPTDKSLVFDSMRFESDYIFLKNKGFVLLRVEASREVCFSRLRERGQIFNENKDSMHKSEIELEKYHHDFTIENSQISIPKLQKTLDSLMTKLINNRNYSN